MAVCASVCVCSVWTAKGACVDVVKKKKEKVKNEDIVSCNLSTLEVPTPQKYLKKRFLPCNP